MNVVLSRQAVLLLVLGLLVSLATAFSPTPQQTAVMRTHQQQQHHHHLLLRRMMTKAQGGDVVAKVEKLVKEGKQGKRQQLLAKVKSIFSDGPAVDKKFENKTVRKYFNKALSNEQLATKVIQVLEKKGYKADNTLLCTSLCCDELARNLEDDFNNLFGKNFNLGGLSGFPFAGNTGFGAMAAHIPDDGYCLVVYGPHVGVAKDGTVGKVERKGIELVDNCCGSAIAASGYLQGITDGGAVVTSKLRSFTDFQQNAVQDLILPHGLRLAEAKNRMLELPFALYDSQDLLMNDIVQAGAGGIKEGLALLGGIQINTGPDTPDYFHPMRFDYINSDGKVVEDMLKKLK